MAMDSSKRSSSSLPFELVEEILYKTPVESLVRFQSVCKQWYAFLNDKRFIYKHLDLSRECFLRLGDRWIQVFNLETQALSSLQCPSNYISVMIHCDGLLLCKCCDQNGIESPSVWTIGITELAVWNPYLRQFKWIDAPSNSYSGYKVVAFGIGYDNVSRHNYKILMTYINRSDENTSNIEIYEFKSRLWRSGDANIDIDWLVHSRCPVGLSMNGNMYWVAEKRKAKSEIFIQSFDFSKETFKRICFVPFKAACFGADHRIILSACRGDRLSILHQYTHVKIEVWVTNKVTDGVVSWSKFFNVTRLDLPFSHSKCSPTYFINKSNSIVLWCDQGSWDYSVPTNINLYEMRDGEIKKQILVEPNRLGIGSTPSVCYVYVPSRVPVPE